MLSSHDITATFNGQRKYIGAKVYVHLSANMLLHQRILAFSHQKGNIMKLGHPFNF